MGAGYRSRKTNYDGGGGMMEKEKEIEVEKAFDIQNEILSLKKRIECLEKVAAPPMEMFWPGLILPKRRNIREI